MMNERIEKINKKSVVFWYKDSADRSKEKKMRLKGEEFIRRFLLHALPIFYTSMLPKKKIRISSSNPHLSS